jgi:hypothetical protein
MELPLLISKIYESLFFRKYKFETIKTYINIDFFMLVCFRTSTKPLF